MTTKSIETLPTRYYHSLPLPSISTTMIILSFFANFGTSMSRNIMFTLITSMTDVTIGTNAHIRENNNQTDDQKLSLDQIVSFVNNSNTIYDLNDNETHLETEKVAKSATVYEFSWTEMEQNWVMNSYLAGLLVMTIPSGYMAYRIGPKCVAAYGGVMTVIINIVSPLAARFDLRLFILMRFLLGAAVSAVMPSILQIVSNWVPDDHRGIALAAISSGSMVGSIVLNIVSSYMSKSHGWASVFYLVTFFNTLWVIIWVIFVSDTPDQHQWIFEDEIQHIRRSLPVRRSQKMNQKGKSPESKPPPYHKMLTNRSVWVTIFVKMAQNFYYYIAVIKLQYYQTAVLKTSFEENCMFIATFHIATFLSINIGGYIADRMLRSGYEVPFVRKASEMISGFFTLYFFLMVPFCDTKISFVIIMFLSAFGNGLNVGGSGAALLDLTTDYVANLTSLINFITLFVGWATPLIVTGLLKLSDGDWSIIFITCSAALFLSSLAFGLFVEPENQHWEFTTFFSTTISRSSRTKALYEIKKSPMNIANDSYSDSKRKDNNR